ncbi:unnamed protein product [Prunus armeniaca]|uniref:Uncharacterized protein n=1 Tax=Prunus armeniaca TaxID=36596 RepID=A0A6J5XGQ6_PRUAR|nr:unnamed protein product [Prunus armeniaca]CAB4311125.1 unnamed protein product [Prunus armeniaca]
MFKSIFQDVHGMKLPAGIGSLKNLLSLTAIHAGGGIAEELGNLIQLGRLGVMDVAEENISELFVSIKKMPALPSLSLELNMHSTRETLSSWIHSHLHHFFKSFA